MQISKITYLAETFHFTYYRGDQREIMRYRKMDNKEFINVERNQIELTKDCIEGNILKLSPVFIYDYLEILKDNGQLLI